MSLWPRVTAQAPQIGKVAPGDNPDLVHCMAFIGTRSYGYISTDPSTVEPQTHCSPGLGMDTTMAPGDSVVYSNLYDLWQHDPQVPIWLLVS